MSLNLTPIRTAIEEVLEGTIGATRTVTADTFRKGGHSGRETGAQQALAMVKPQYETIFREFTNNDATPISAKASARLADLTVEIRFRYAFSSEILEDKRTTLLDTVLNDGDVAWQALSYPGNLTETNASVATNIISGMLVGPYSFAIDNEDWDNHLVVAELTAVAQINVSQAV